jgi:orotate phosphoribosyltransferase
MAFIDVSEELARDIASGLLEIGAVELRPDSPFTWSSGWKSPIYCDNRLVLGHPGLRNLVVTGFEVAMKKWFKSADSISGAATGGIAHAALLADRLHLPMSYVRGSAKGHGQGKRVEGFIRPGTRTVVIEDTISTGASAYSAANGLREEKLEVLGVLSIFSYDFAVAMARAEEERLKVVHLLNYDTLIAVAQEKGVIRPEDVERLLAWRATPDKYA